MQKQQVLPKAERPWIIAHRGFSAAAPENTLAAFRLAHEAGADFFELDCQWTRDRQIIVMHDERVDRTTNGKGRVADLTLAAIRNLDAGSWKAPAFLKERVPTLEETLRWAHGRIGIYIELKTFADEAPLTWALQTELAKPGTDVAQACRQVGGALEQSPSAQLARRVAEMVRQTQMEGAVVLQSFSPVICAALLAGAPDLRIELLGSEDKKNPQIWNDFTHWGGLLRVDGLNPDAAAVTAERLAQFHGAGQTVAAWTVDQPAEMERLMKLGVDGVITNQPDRALALRRSLPKKAGAPAQGAPAAIQVNQ